MTLTAALDASVDLVERVASYAAEISGETTFRSPATRSLNGAAKSTPTSRSSTWLADPAGVRIRERVLRAARAGGILARAARRGTSARVARGRAHPAPSRRISPSSSRASPRTVG